MVGGLGRSSGRRGAGRCLEEWSGGMPERPASREPPRSLVGARRTARLPTPAPNVRRYAGDTIEAGGKQKYVVLHEQDVLAKL